MTTRSLGEVGQLTAALLLLRIACAPPFLYHGSAILFGVFTGPGPAQFAASHHWPAIIGYLVGLAQVGGGLALLSGILFRLGAASVSVVMVGAILIVHLRHGFDVQNGGVEFALAQLLMSLALLLTGPGNYSLGRFLPQWLQRF